MSQLPGLSEQENEVLEGFVRLIADHLKATETLAEMFEKVDSVMSSEAGKTAVTRLLPMWRTRVNERITMTEPTS
jgi:hypothetical protein